VKGARLLPRRPGTCPFVLFGVSGVILLGTLGRMFSRVRFSRWWQAVRRSPGWVPGAVTAVVLALVIGAAGVAGIMSAASTGAQPGPRPAGQQAAHQQAAGRVTGAAHQAGPDAGRAAGDGPRAGSATRAVSGSRAGRPGQATGSSQGSAAGSSRRAGAKLAASAAAAGHRLRTSCRAVAHIGDSTSVGMVSADYLPDPAQRLVHLGRDPLHLGRVRGPGPDDRPRARPGVPEHRAQQQLPDQVNAGHNARMAGPVLSQPMPGYASAAQRSRPNL
jgi:hypothetical protein